MSRGGGVISIQMDKGNMGRRSMDTGIDKYR